MDTPPVALAHAPIADAPPSFPTHGAGFWMRFLARLVDLVFTLLLGLVTGFGVGLLVALLASLDKAPADWQERAKEGNTFGIGIVAMFIYVTIAEGIGGATLGKLICGLRTVSMDGGPCSFGAAFKRDLAYHFDALFFGLVGYASMKTSDLQQRYGDKWADTVVVEASDFTSTPPRKAWQITLGILLGTFVWVLIIGGDLMYYLLR